MTLALVSTDRFLPFRYMSWALSAVALLSGFWWWRSTETAAWWPVGAGLLFLIGVYDVLQRRHAILRNYPLIGHLRFLLEYVRPEIRQYFIESSTEAAPFSRMQRSLVYQRAKNEEDKQPFGSQLDVGADGYEWMNHSMAPTTIASPDFRVVIGAGRAQPYSSSLLNVSGMSFGALGGHAIRALNLGAKQGGFAHDTGEGSISAHHRAHGGDLVWQVASGYFGCRHLDGSFDPQRFAAQAADPQVKMIELKLSQGAKPGHGGILPAAKVTAEIAAAREVPPGVDCVSPSSHSAFRTPVEMMHFIEQLRQLSGGKPVGFKLCIGHPWEWFALCKAMLKTDIVPDFIVVDGSEGGTGAAPVEFIDHVGAPLQEGLLLVHNTLVGLNLRERVRVGAAGKVVSAFDIARMMALGADWCNAGRAFMFALGCVQAQTCHTGHCPTGVTTHDPLRQRALVVEDKAARVLHFHHNTMHALRELTQAAGLHHPNEIRATHIVRRGEDRQVHLLARSQTFLRPGRLLAAMDGLVPWPHSVFQLYWPQADADSFAAWRAPPR
ncbi:MAG: FMN-binding glutamate synthase family protein [Steroidobacteraceae bacterium]